MCVYAQALSCVQLLQPSEWGSSDSGMEPASFASPGLAGSFFTIVPPEMLIQYLNIHKYSLNG